MNWLELYAALPVWLASKRTGHHKTKIHDLTGHARHGFIVGGIHFLEHGTSFFRGEF